MNCNYKVKITDIQTKYKFKVFCTGYDDSELKQKIDTMYEAWPKASGEGETVTLDNTANATMTLDLKGNTSQYTTTGKNLFDTSLLPITHDGITISQNDNGDIVINGTPNYSDGYKMFYTGNTRNLEAGTYTISVANKEEGLGVSIGGFGGTLNLAMSDNSTTRTSTSTETYTITPQVNIRYDAGTFNNYVINPQLEKTASKTDYEPYTNGASPNPDYPQDVHVVTGDNTINICGKNLFDKNKAQLNVGINTSNGNTYNDTNLFSTEYIPISVNTSYVSNSASTTGNRVFGACYDINKNYLGAVSTGVGERRFTITNENAKYIRITGQKINIDNYQLEKGSTATTYEPYQSQSYAVNLGNMELCKIGNYQDYIYKDNKKWYKKEYIRKADITSSTNITMENASANVGKRFNIYDEGGSYFSGNATQPGAISNCYKPSYSTSVANVIFSSSTYGAVSLVDAKYTSVESFKSWAIENLIIYRILSTPTTTEITDATLISQLEALAGAESYAGQTNISQTNNDKPFIITAKALKDLSNL